ncbi:CCA tRNA nucleotidyltransferase [Anaeromicrobium sediminis]|uniref:HD/PDEase domain-containing protein n=1 Tax=Anaeromicrobium sediminis TaxID=1478221 RepID=A0A267MQ49_9FIRM|nr:CCA tRNA nucleotidyltransferase [Anaeromicrobium sediminis]PAB61025.1 hypothetical protein CCE28_00925 [Anaeromicrobium sediminis]
MINKAKEIMKTLIDNGYEAYLVGGCVRDSILGVTPKDYDIATNAVPSIIKKLFKKTIPTGEKYGTITVMLDEELFEVTTYRLESEYIDERRPNVVKFAKTLREDLERRDFTINSMAMDIEENIIDHFNGQQDLMHGIISCVGSAYDRLAEDKLRILRAFRFASRYDFEIHRDIFYAIEEDNDISNLSKERIREEFNKIILSKKPSTWISRLFETGLLKQIIPELCVCYNFHQHNPHHSKNVFDHILTVVDSIQPKLELRLAALFHDIGKPQTFSIDNGIGHFFGHSKESARICEEVMTELKYSNKEIGHVRELVYWHMNKCDTNKPRSIKKFIRGIGEDRLEDLYKLKIADLQGSNAFYEDFREIFKIKFACEKVLFEKQPLSIRDLKINGNDLINAGIEQGKQIGIILNKLLESVLDDPEMNKRDILLEEVGKMVRE